MLLAVLTLGSAAAQADDGTGFAIRGPSSPYLSGQVSFQLDWAAAGPPVSTVCWYLDGRQVARLDQAPYRVLLDLGPDVLPHRISATAFSADARQLWTGEFRTQGLAVAYSDRVALVVVPVTVMHPEGWFHTGLSREAFTVYEDGESRELTCFANDVVPLSVALVIDTSKSMRGNLREVKKAARKLIDRLAPDDVATVISFDDDLVRHCPFTGESERLLRALDGLGPAGGTALCDAVYGATRAFQDTGGKRVVILFTDGRDEKYRRPAEAKQRLKRSISAASRENITLYTIGLGDGVDEERLSWMADTSGGAYFHLGAIRDLAGAYDTIFDELGSQYTLCYRPGPAAATDEPAWRTIRVEVADPTLLVRHKKGYSPAR